MISIEISYTTEEEGYPEHYGYCDSFKEAHELLKNLGKQLGQADETCEEWEEHTDD